MKKHYTVTIRCRDCNAERLVKPQDAGIVTRCKEHQKLRTLQLRRNRAKQQRLEHTRRVKRWRGQVQILAKKTRLNKTQTSEILTFFEKIVGQPQSELH
jgi:DNA-directed RNA polymerase subunit RPC12/RpoP